MPVLEHEQYRSAAADVREQLGNRRVEAMALGIGVGLDRLGSSPTRAGRSGSSRVSSPPPAPSAARSSAASVTRTSRSSASTNGPYGVRTTASQAP